MQKWMTKEDTSYEIPIEALAGKVGNLNLPDPALLNQYRLLDERKISLDEAVDWEVLDVQRQILLWNIQDKDLPVDQRIPIWIYIFNYGGFSDLSQGLIDVMEASTTPIYTVNMGMAASAAADIFIAGKKRFMLRNARTMFHQGAGAIAGDAQKMRDNIEDYNRKLERFKVFLLSRTCITEEEYEQYKYNDWWLTAQECMDRGVCDVIVNSLDEVI